MLSVEINHIKEYGTPQMARQLPFALAVALTRTAKDAQQAVIDNLEDIFTIRTKWYLPSRKYGIRITTAKKHSLVASVGTDAEWLELHEDGGTKKPKGGGSIAIPTENIRPPGSKKKITKRMRPRNLARRFVIDTKSGPVMFQRKGIGKRQKIQAVYTLEDSADIKRQASVFDPVSKTVEHELFDHFEREFDKALATAR